MKLEEEIQQRKFRNEFHKLQINLLFTTSWMNQLTAQVLKPYNISWQQFNILRILKGMHPEPATVKVLTSKMIDKMSNASRLVEKLRQKNYIERKECKSDRRRVDIEITPLGLEVVEKTTQELNKLMDKQMANISEADAQMVNDVLDRMRMQEIQACS